MITIMHTIYQRLRMTVYWLCQQSCVLHKLHLQQKIEDKRTHNMHIIRTIAKDTQYAQCNRHTSALWCMCYIPHYMHLVEI